MTISSSRKGADAFRTISEVAEMLGVPQHVLRFWETKFTQIRPLKRAGGRRFYRPEDVELLLAIKTLLYGNGYTIKGVQRLLKEQGARAVTVLAVHGKVSPPYGPDLNQCSEPDQSDTDDFRPENHVESSEDWSDSSEMGDAPLARTFAPALSQQLRIVLLDLAECRSLLEAAVSRF